MNVAHILPVALVVLSTACQSPVLGTAGPEASDDAASKSTTSLHTGPPRIEIRSEGALEPGAPGVAEATSWLEQGCRAQPEFTGKEPVGVLKGTYRAARQGPPDGPIVNSVYFGLALELNADEHYKTEAFVGEKLRETLDKPLADLVRTVAAETTANLAKQVRAAHATDDALLKMLDDTDVDTVSFAIAEVRKRRLKAAAPKVARHLADTNRDVVNLAAGALADVGSSRDVPALIRAGSRAEPVDRLPVLYALGEIGGPEVVTYLETLAEETNNPAVKGAAERALARARRR